MNSVEFSITVFSSMILEGGRKSLSPLVFAASSSEIWISSASARKSFSMLSMSQIKVSNSGFNCFCASAPEKIVVVTEDVSNLSMALVTFLGSFDR